MIANSVFFPQNDEGNNPYQKELSNALNKTSITVTGLSYRIFFILDVIMLPKPTVLHLHWLHSFLTRATYTKSLVSSAIFLLQLLILRVLGVEIVWTVHNLKNHDNKFLSLERVCRSLVAKICHSLIVHCDAVQGDVIKILNLKDPNKIHAVPHGNYIDSYQNSISRESARNILNLTNSGTTFLFLGLIRPYKGVPELIDAFSATNNLEDAHLLIAGKVWGEDKNFRNLIDEKVENTSNATLVPEFIADEDLQLYFNACDVVVFPYKDILTSGAVLLAMSFGKACIAPQIGCICDTLDSDGSFLYDPQSPHGLSNAIELAINSKSNLRKMGQHNLHLAKQNGWSRIASMTLDIYQHNQNIDSQKPVSGSLADKS